MMTFKLTDYDVLSTGVDGGHYYISTEVEYKGIRRKISIFFKNKFDEKIILSKKEIVVKGNLFDEGLQQSLILLEAEII